MALMAPAFGFARRWPERLGAAAVEEWKRTGALEVFHYGEGRTRSVGYELLEDGAVMKTNPDVTQPCLIFHGVHDDVVPAQFSRDFAAGRSNVRLELMDSGHDLLNVLEVMADGVETFLRGKLPGNAQQRHRLPRQIECDPAAGPPRSAIRAKSATATGPPLPTLVLFRRGLLRRTHPLPHRVGVAVGLIDAVMLHQRARGRHSGDRQMHGRCRRGHIVVVIVPHQDRYLALGARRDAVDLRRLVYAILAARRRSGLRRCSPALRDRRASGRPCGTDSESAYRCRSWPASGIPRSTAGLRTQTPTSACRRCWPGSGPQVAEFRPSRRPCNWRRAAYCGSAFSGCSLATHAAQPSGSDSLNTIGKARNSG